MLTSSLECSKGVTSDFRVHKNSLFYSVFYSFNNFSYTQGQQLANLNGRCKELEDENKMVSICC